jgi:hypothetical protein
MVSCLSRWAGYEGNLLAKLLLTGYLPRFLLLRNAQLREQAESITGLCAL